MRISRVFPGQESSFSPHTISQTFDLDRIPVDRLVALGSGLGQILPKVNLPLTEAGSGEFAKIRSLGQAQNPGGGTGTFL